MADAATLKSYFETGDRPTEAQFAAFIDSVHPDVVTLGTFSNYIEDDVTITDALADLVTAIEGVGGLTIDSIRSASFTASVNTIHPVSKSGGDITVTLPTGDGTGSIVLTDEVIGGGTLAGLPKALFHFESNSGGFLNEMGGKFTGGNVSNNLSEFKFGAACLQMNPSTGSFTLEHLESFQGDWTVDYWVKFNSTVETDFEFLAFSSQAGHSGVTVRTTSSDVIEITTYGAGGGTATGSTTLSADTWYHFAIEYDNTAEDFTVYLDGVEEVTIARGTDTLPDTSESIYIENDSTGTVYVDELRISDSLQYGGDNFTPETSAYTDSVPYIALSHCAGLTDGALNNEVNTGSPASLTTTNVTVGATAKFGAFGAVLPASASIVVDGAEIDATVDHFVDFWIRFETAVEEDTVLYTWETATGECKLRIDEMGQLELDGTSVSSGPVNGYTSFSTGTWYHILVEYQKNAGIGNQDYLEVWVDGDSEIFNELTTVPGSDYGIEISTPAGTSGNVYIDEIRVGYGNPIRNYNFTPETSAYTFGSGNSTGGSSASTITVTGTGGDDITLDSKGDRVDYVIENGVVTSQYIPPAPQAPADLSVDTITTTGDVTIGGELTTSGLQTSIISSESGAIYFDPANGLVDLGTTATSTYLGPSGFGHFGKSWFTSATNGEVAINAWDGATPAKLTVGNYAAELQNASDVGLSIELAASHTGNAIEVNSNGGSDGDLIQVDSAGLVTYGTGHSSGVWVVTWGASGEFGFRQDGVIACEEIRYQQGDAYPAIRFTSGDMRLIDGTGAIAFLLTSSGYSYFTKTWGQNQMEEAAPTGTTATLTLNDGNYHDLDLSSTTGDVTVTLTKPNYSSHGIIDIEQHGTTARDITWAVSSGSIKWVSVEPTWNADPTGSLRSISWHWNASRNVLFLWDAGQAAT